MDSASMIELVRIIQAGKSWVALVRVFGDSAKNLCVWLTRADRERRLMRRILGDQVSIREWAENVRDWRRRYEGLKWSVHVNSRG